MRAINYDKDQKTSTLYFDEVPIPDPDSDEVLIRVHAFGLNRADLLQVRGQYPPPAGASEIPGLECSGIIEEVGENVTKWKAGDHVCGLVDGGAYAEYCLMDSGMIWRKPEGASWVEAAAMPETYLTAYQALYQLMDVTTMERVLIHAAASGVGSAAVQLLSDLDIKKWGTASGPKIDFCLDRGYDAVIDYQKYSFLEKVMGWTGGSGVDGIVDVVGGDYFQDNIKALALDGTLVMLGLLSGVQAGQVNILPLISRRLTIQGSTLRSRSVSYKRELVRGFLDRFHSKIQRGELKPEIYKNLSWADSAQAHDLMRQNKNSGKIVLSIQ